jgi:hypothetical protein
MNVRTCILIVAVAMVLAPAGFLWPSLAAQDYGVPRDDQRNEDVKLPSGKSQRDAILKDEHEKSLRDAARLVKLAGELETELKEKDYHVLSIPSLKKAEDIEKLARRIRDRMKH